MKMTRLKLSRKWTIFSVTATGTFMSTLAAGILNIALPTMAEDFQVGIDDIQLVVSLYLLVRTCLLPVFGKFSDMYSRKWMYLGGFITFGLGALGGALALSFNMLLWARLLQGIGSSAMMATSQALITQVFHGKSRAKALGAISAVMACGELTGPAIGGPLIKWGGWQAAFWILLPICLIGVWRGIHIIPRFKPKHIQFFEIPGALLFLCSGGACLWALSNGTACGWNSPIILGCWIFTLLFGLLFFRREKTSKHPFIGLDIFKIPAISYGLVIAVLGFTAVCTNSILLPFYLTEIMHMDPVKIGLLMLPFPAMLVLSSAVSGALCVKRSTRTVTMIGFIFLIIANAMFAFIENCPHIFYIVLAQLIMGIGSGTFQVPNNTAVLSASPREHLGVVASVNALARNLGMILGTVLSVAVYSLVEHYLILHTALTKQEAFIYGYMAALLFGTLCAVGGGILSLKRN